ncbi:MAG: acyl-CoA reductase [Candidatus Caenarcaniphilales bacterium]|nr:acyl-CoA reductase [Candidatus Caenarcaniphilales bacterium]
MKIDNKKLASIKQSKKFLSQLNDLALIDLIEDLFGLWFCKLDENFIDQFSELIGLKYDQLQVNLQYFSKVKRKELLEIQGLLRNSYRSSNNELNLFFGASTIPITPFTEILYSLLLKTPIICRIPENYSLDFYKYFYDKIPQELTDTVSFTTWPSNDDETTQSFMDLADCIILHGSDQTVSDLSKYAKGKTFLGFGHKASFALMKKNNNKNQLKEQMRKLASDIYSFNQLGCLSPQCVYLIDFDDNETLYFANHLSQSLKKKAFDLTSSISFSKQSFFEEVSLKKEIRIIDDLVIIDNSTKTSNFISEFDYSFGYGTIWVKSINSINELFFSTEKLKERIACIGTNLSKGEIDNLAKSFPLSRICEVGEMQNPSLYWLQKPTKIIKAKNKLFSKQS